MQVNWARWQQPIGGNCNYNFQFQSFHCAVGPQTPLTQININSSWQQQLQQVYLGLLIQSQQQLQQFSSSSLYGQFGSAFNLSFNRGQNYTNNNYNTNHKNSSSSKKTKTFTEPPSKIITTPNPNPSDTNNSINNDETMDPKDFVMATRFNAFALHFKNTNAISEDQVQDIFSVYGKIKRVKQTGDDHGICFVNFENEEDAMKAAVGVKGHPDLKLRAAKLIRSKNSTDFNNGNGNGGSNDDNFNGNNFSSGNARKNYSNENENSNDYANQNGQRNYSDGNRRNNYSNDNDNNKTDCFNEPDDQIKIVESKSDEFTVPVSSEVNTEIKTTETSAEEISSYGDNHKKTFNTLQSSETPVPTSVSVENHRCEDNEKSDQRSTISLKSEVQVPDLVAKISRMSMASSIKSVDFPAAIVPIEKMAAEVLVANIHEGVNLHAILQLLDKYHPIAASNILTYEPSNMRYCRVYFTSQDRAEYVEAEFDNCVLMDKPLLVVRASSLIN